MKFFNTFRGRLLVILSVLLITTLGVQFFLNYQSEEENKRLRELQEKALVSGMTIGVTKMVSSDSFVELNKKGKLPALDENVKNRLQDILVINEEWEIEDSFNNPIYLPKENASGGFDYYKLSEIRDLPPLVDAESFGSDRLKFPNAQVMTDAEREKVETETNGESHAIPIQTSRGRWYVMIAVRSNKSEATWRAARPLIYTLAVLLVSSLITILLVWRFTSPIAKLSEAARNVALGNLNVRVPIERNTNEMGKLALRFNEMTARLETTRELELKLQDTEKSAVVGRLASAIAHEIRNPLNYINLTLDHLRAKFVPEDDAKRETFEKLTSQLKTEVGRINTQISDFLRYSKPLQLEKKPINVRDLIDDSLRIIEAQAADQAIELQVSEAANLPKILGDEDVLRSVFNNLFINSLQSFTVNSGKILTDIKLNQNFVTIEISDSGCGIPAENLSKIFEPYFSTKETGTGLGLAIVKKIVDDHNGTIEAESTFGEGTKFTLNLPI
jgi:signal transduction histidine kinase